MGINMETNSIGGDSSNSNIICTSDLGSHCNLFKDCNSKLKKSHKILTETINNYTKQEQLEVEKAINALNKKVELIMENEKMKEFTKNTTDLQSKMYESLQKVIIVFEKFRKTTLE